MIIIQTHMNIKHKLLVALFCQWLSNTFIALFLLYRLGHFSNQIKVIIAVNVGIFSTTREMVSHVWEWLDNQTVTLALVTGKCLVFWVLSVGYRTLCYSILNNILCCFFKCVLFRCRCCCVIVVGYVQISAV